MPAKISRKQVADWILLHAFECKELDPPDDIAWLTLATSLDETTNINVFVTKDEPDVLHFERRLILNDDQIRTLSEAPPAVASRVVGEAVRDLVLMGTVRYKLKLDEEGELTGLSLIRDLWVEEVTRPAVSQCLNVMIDAGILVQFGFSVRGPALLESVE